MGFSIFLDIHNSFKKCVLVIHYGVSKGHDYNMGVLGVRFTPFSDYNYMYFKIMQLFRETQFISLFWPQNRLFLKKRIPLFKIVGNSHFWIHGLLCHKMMDC